MTPSGTPADPRYGWVMVFATFTLSALAFGTVASVSVFLKPLAAEFAWTRSETALGYSTIAFASALCGVMWGYLADKVGSRWFGVIGALSLITGVSSQRKIGAHCSLSFLLREVEISCTPMPVSKARAYSWVSRRLEMKGMFRLNRNRSSE